MLVRDQRGRIHWLIASFLRRRPWDVCVRLVHFLLFRLRALTSTAQAGIVIAQEAGALIRGSPSTLDDTNWFTEEFLWGRKFIVVRCITIFTDPGITRRRTICVYYFCLGLFLTRQYELTLDYPPRNLTCSFGSTGGNRSRCTTADHARVL